MYYHLALAAGLATLAFLQGCQGCRVSKVEPGEEEGNVETAPPPDETGDPIIPTETGDTGGDEFLFTEEPRALIHFNNGGIGSILSVNIEELLAVAEQINDGDIEARPEVVTSTGLPVGQLLTSGGRVFLLGADTLTQIDPVTANSTGDDYNSWFADFVADNSLGTPLDVQFSSVTGYTYVPFESGTLIINPDGSRNGLERVSSGNFGSDTSTWKNGPGGVDNNGIYYQSINLGDRIGFSSFDGDDGDHNNDSMANTAPLYSAHLLFNPITNLFYGTNDSGIISVDPVNPTDGEVPVQVVLAKEDIAPSGSPYREEINIAIRDPQWMGGENNFIGVLELSLEEDGTILTEEHLASLHNGGYTAYLSDPDEPDAYSTILDAATTLTRSGTLVVVGTEEDEVHVWRYSPDDGLSQRVTLPGNGLFAEYGSPASVTSGTLAEDGTWSDFPWELGGWFYEEG